MMVSIFDTLNSFSVLSCVVAESLLYSFMRSMDETYKDFIMIQNSRQAFAGVPDEPIVDMARSGDDQAFAELVERHQNSCLKLALSILRDKSDVGPSAECLLEGISSSRPI